MISNRAEKSSDPTSYQALLDENYTLKEELESLKARLQEAEELKRAIHEGDLDALVIYRPEGELIFTLDSADKAYRALVETMNEGTVTISHDGTILYCNRRFAELMKMSPQAIVGASVYQFIASENIPIFKAFLKQETITGEINLVANGGTNLPVYLSVSSLKYEDSPNSWCLVTTDLTEQKRNEEIVASERLARSIIEQAAEAIIVCDDSGRITRFSNAITKICKCDPAFQKLEDIIDLRSSEGENKGKSILPVSEALKGFTILGLEVTLEVKDSETSYLLLSSSPLKKENGKIIGCIITLADITERKKAENELQENKEHFELLSKTNALLLSSDDPEGIIQIIAENVARSLNLDVFFNYVFDEKKGKLHLNAYGGINEEMFKEIEWLDKGTAICGCVAQEGTRIISEDVQLNCDKRADLVRSIGVKAYACQPLRIGEKTIGTLSFGTKTRKSFSENELTLIRNVADQVSVAMQRSWAEKAMRESEERLRLLGNNLPDSALYQYMHEFDGTVRFLYFSSGIERLNGVRAEDIIQNPALLHGQILQPYYDQLIEEETRSSRELSDLDMEIPMQGPDGEVRWMHLHSRPRRLEDGRTVWDGVQIDITEHKQIAEALRESEARRMIAEAVETERMRLFDILETLPAMICLLTPDYKLSFANRSFREKFGDSGGKPCYKHCFGLDQPCEFCEAYKVFETGQPHHWEFTTRDGSVIDAYDFPFTDIDGSPLILEMDMDITKRRKAEEALESSREKYCIVTEQTGQLIYDFDMQDKKVNWAGAVEEITGYTPDEFKFIQFDAWKKYVHPDDFKLSSGKVNNLWKQGGKLSNEFRFRRKDGAYIYIEERGICLLDQKGNPYRVLGAMTDITDRKLFEEKIQKSEEKYRSFMQNLKGIAFQLDEDSNTEFIHGATEEITGYTEQELMQGRLWKKLVLPEDMKVFHEGEKNAIKYPEDYQGELEYRIRAKDGRIKWIYEIHQKTRNANLKPIYTGIVYDVTEKKEAEEALEKMDKMRIKEIHHRIKNNLQVISSLLSLEAEKFSDEKMLEAFRQSQNRVASMALIHEELYKGNKSDALDFASYLNKLTEDLFRSYNPGYNNIQLKLELESAYLDMDTAIPLGIIVNELVSNSFKHAFPSGTTDGEICIALQEIETLGAKQNMFDFSLEQIDKNNFDYVLRVTDNGIGVPEEIEFENTESLGFQLINVLVEQIDGHIELKRKQGTKFTILFNNIGKKL